MRPRNPDAFYKSTAPVPVLPPQPHHQGIPMADEWPLQSYLELGLLPTAVACARLHVKNVLWEWGLQSFAEPVELLVSELVTNAVKVSRSLAVISPVRLWLYSDRASVLILVWDADTRPPVRMHIVEEAESGRGLLLVEALSQKWDWYAHKGMGGKVVWALTVAPVD
jgi:anti-sigma regulatory factor (Ser/Thr protein kinase)